MDELVPTVGTNTNVQEKTDCRHLLQLRTLRRVRQELS